LSLKRLSISIKYILCLPERVNQPFKYINPIKKPNNLYLFKI
jgi:hypothetical protein